MARAAFVRIHRVAPDFITVAEVEPAKNGFRVRLVVIGGEEYSLDVSREGEMYRLRRC